MPKTIRNVWKNALVLEKLMEAHMRASKGKHSSCEVLLFEMNLETNLSELLKKSYFVFDNFFSIIDIHS